MNKTALNSQKEKHSMLSLRRATFVGLAAHRLRNISIHALLAESDKENEKPIAAIRLPMLPFAQSSEKVVKLFLRHNFPIATAFRRWND